MSTQANLMCMTLGDNGSHDICMKETIGSVCSLQIRGYAHIVKSLRSEYGNYTGILVVHAACSFKYGHRFRAVDGVRKSLACEVPGGCTLSPFLSLTAL